MHPEQGHFSATNTVSGYTIGGSIRGLEREKTLVPAGLAGISDSPTLGCTRKMGAPFQGRNARLWCKKSSIPGNQGPSPRHIPGNLLKG
jgi:hypothetical protein